MPAAGRVHPEDFVLCNSHSCDKKICCVPPHTVQGPAVVGAKKTFINGFPALRLRDKGVHDKSTCCGPNQWIALKCVSSRKVFIEGSEAFCVGDISLHDGKHQGNLMKGSENVTVG